MDGPISPAPPPRTIGAPEAWSDPAVDVPWRRPATRASHRLPRRRSAAWAGLLGWLVPGLGQAYLGRYGAALALLVVIGGTFAGGLALTDFTCVDPRTYQLEAVAHALIGGPSALTLYLTQGLTLDRMPPFLEVGRLYVVVAGFLNLVAICDAMGECWRRNARLQALRARLALRATPPHADPVMPSEPALAAPPARLEAGPAAPTLAPPAPPTASDGSPA